MVRTERRSLCNNSVNEWRIHGRKALREAQVAGHSWLFSAITRKTQFNDARRGDERFNQSRERSRPARKGATICSSSTPVIWLIGSV